MMTTLDEYLQEVDRWKQTAQAKIEDLSATDRLQRLLVARERLEQTLGERLPELSPPVSNTPTT